jgi:hypothetical protein
MSATANKAARAINSTDTELSADGNYTGFDGS